MATDFLHLHPFVRTTAADKARGVILGGALGDALGLYTEFLSSKEAAQWYSTRIDFGVTPLRDDSHRDRFSVGSWTDDTDHALLLVLSFLHHYGSNQRQCPSPSTLGQDFAARLECWVRQGQLALLTLPLGLGHTIGTMAYHPSFLADPKALARKMWTKAPDQAKPASNGSLMRTHPLGVIAAAYNTDDEALELAAEISRTTHGEPRCTLACCSVVLVLRGLIRGEVTNEDELDRSLNLAEAYVKARPELCESEWKGTEAESTDPYQWLRLDEFKAYTGRQATYDSIELDDKPKIGYIYKCLAAGIFTLRLAMRQATQTAPTSETFENIMLDLIMQGGDADTNGSVAGALLGAWLGESRLPQAWIRSLRNHDWLQSKAVRFAAAAGIQDQRGIEAWEREPKDADADIHGGRQPLTKEELDERYGEFLKSLNAKNAARREMAKKEEAAQHSTKSSKRASFWQSIARK